MVELLTAGLFAGVAGRFGYDWAVPAYLVLFAGLLALSWIDVERMLLPKAIVWPLLALVGGLLLVPAAVYGLWHNYSVAWAFAAGWFLVFFALNFTRIRGPCSVSGMSRLAAWFSGLGPRLAGGALRDPRILRGQPDQRRVIGINVDRDGEDASGNSRSYGVFLAAGTAVAVFRRGPSFRPFTACAGLNAILVRRRLSSRFTERFPSSPLRSADLGGARTPALANAAGGPGRAATSSKCEVSPEGFWRHRCVRPGIFLISRSRRSTKPSADCLGHRSGVSSLASWLNSRRPVHGSLAIHHLVRALGTEKQHSANSTQAGQQAVRSSIVHGLRSDRSTRDRTPALRLPIRRELGRNPSSRLESSRYPIRAVTAMVAKEGR